MSFINNTSRVNLDSLNDNIGRVVIIFTSSGGCSGKGFTGVLASANSCSCKLITSLPNISPNPFANQSNMCGTQFGTAVEIPINQIVAVCSSQI